MALLPGTVCAWIGDDALDVAAGLPATDHVEKANGNHLGGSAFGKSIIFADGAPPPGTPVEPASPGSRVLPPSDYIKDYFPNVLGGTERILRKDNLPITLIGLGLTGLAFTVDTRVKNYFQNDKPLIHVDKYGDVFGAGAPEVAISLVLFGSGELASNRTLADAGAASLEAYAINGIATELLKYVVERKRPNGKDKMSFPSGHTSVTATMAASISEMYNWDPRIATPLYVFTAFVGASRIQANDHYLSDVIAGATLGTVIGMTTGKYHKERSAKEGQQNILITPLLDKDLKGSMLSLRF